MQNGPRRFRRPPYRAVGIVVVLVVLAIGRYFGPQPDAPPQAPGGEGEHHVVRVVDGDTIIIDRDTRVRLIGVNAPESVKPDHPVEPWGPEASDFTKQFLADGTVRLTYDNEREDQYGRALAYVWVGDKLLNEELVRQGLARYEPQYRYAEDMKRRFRKAQQDAQKKHAGIWSDESSRR